MKKKKIMKKKDKKREKLDQTLSVIHYRTAGIMSLSATDTKALQYRLINFLCCKRWTALSKKSAEYRGEI